MADEAGQREETLLLAGRYRVDGLLGRGGMSEVYYGYDERLDRRVAIKVLRPPGTVPAAPDSPGAAKILDALHRDRRRFLREIRTTAKLEHPGTPAVYDTGIETAADGTTRLWLVMQLLRGTTVGALLDRTDYESSPPSVAWAAAIAAQVAAVLADVHRVDIVHRDIKPANVMVVDGGLIKVLDFGIAILRGAGALPRLTQVDRTVGTPAYMSPEQGLGQAVTSASDIYSLGCLLLELLTGDVPFCGTADVLLRTQHLNSPAPSVHSRRGDAPEAVDTLVSSMLAKDPRARPSATHCGSGSTTSSARHFSTPVSTRAPHRCSTLQAVTTAGTCRPRTRTSSTALITPATPTPRPASLRRPCHICGSTCKTPTPRPTRMRQPRFSNPDTSSRRCSLASATSTKP